MALIKSNGLTTTTANTPMPRVPAPVAASSAAPPTPAPSASPSVAELMAQLQAANAALASEKARADAAAAAAAAGRGRGYSLKVSDNTGIVCIWGTSAVRPTTIYVPHLVGIVTDLALSGKMSAFIRENAARLSVKVNGDGQVGTDASRAEVNRLADKLDAALAAFKAG